MGHPHKYSVDGGRQDKGTGKGKNVAGAAPKVYRNSDYKPEPKSKSSTKYKVGPGESYSGVRWDMLPQAERDKRKESIPIAGPIAGAALDVLSVPFNLAGGRKNIIYRQGKTPTKRETGK